MIVGHNIYLDIMFIYDKFIDHLPTSYNEYKKAIHQLFPDVYDTKHLSLELKKVSLGLIQAWQISRGVMYIWRLTKSCLLYQLIWPVPVFNALMLRVAALTESIWHLFCVPVNGAIRIVSQPGTV